MIEKPKAENCFDVYEEYTKTGEEILVYRSEAIDKYIDALRMGTVEKVVDDFTRWRKCDPVTGKPDDEYFRSHPKLTLVKVKFNYLGEDIEVVKIAKWDHNRTCWKFQCNVDRLYEERFKDRMSKEEWYRLQYEGCRELKEEKANEGRDKG